MRWEELDLAQRGWNIPKSRTKNAKAHIVHLSNQSLTVLKRMNRRGPYVFSVLGTKPFQEFSKAKRELDWLSEVTEWRLHDLRRTCVSGMARLGIAPHVADKILNHQSGTISGVAAVYQRHDFLAERLCINPPPHAIRQFTKTAYLRGGACGKWRKTRSRAIASLRLLASTS